jgi:hypothetical protein
LHGGSFIGRGGTQACAISNEAGGVLHAQAVTATGQQALERNYGLVNSGTAWLSGGSFTGRGGAALADLAYGIQNRASLDAQGVTANGENADTNFGFENNQNAARLNGGFFTARGGSSSTAIKNYNQAGLLQAQGVTALAQDATIINEALDNSGDYAWLVGGSYTAERGDQAHAIAVGRNGSTLVADNISALAQDGQNENRGLNSFGIDTVVRLSGGSFVARGGSAAVGIYDAAIGSNRSFKGDNVRVWAREGTSANYAIHTSTVLSVTGSHLTGAPAIFASTGANVFLGTSQLEGGFTGTGTVTCANSHDGVGQALDRTCGTEAEDGTVKAAVLLMCGNAGSVVRRSFNREEGDIIVTDGAQLGSCTIDFGFDISARYWTATSVAGATQSAVMCGAGANSRALQCTRFDTAGTGVNGDIMVVIH